MSIQRYSDAASLHRQVDFITGYRRPEFQETMDRMGLIRAEVARLGHSLINTCPIGNELWDALDLLDDLSMKAIASLARHEPAGSTPNTTSHPKPKPTGNILNLIAVLEKGDFYTDYDESLELLRKAKVDLGLLQPQNPDPRPDPAAQEIKSFAQSYPKEIFGSQLGAVAPSDKALVNPADTDHEMIGFDDTNEGEVRRRVKDNPQA